MADETIDIEVEGETPAGTQDGQMFELSDIFTDEQTKNACISYVCEEIIAVRDDKDRGDLIARWKKYRRQRRARPEKTQRDTPWIKSANVEPPLTQQITHTIWAKEVGAFAGRKPLVLVDPLTPDEANSQAKAETLSRFMNRMAMDRTGLDWKSRSRSMFYNQVSLGMTPVKVPFLVDTYKFKRKNGTGAGTEDVIQVRHKGPALVEIELEDLFVRPYYKNLDRAPWVGVRYRFFRHELQQKGMAGFYDPEQVLKVLGNPVQKYDDNTEAAASDSKIGLESVGSGEPNNEYEIYEVNVFWDVDGDGVPEDLILHIDPDTQTVLRSEFNPLPFRDIEPVFFMEDPRFIWGIGSCEMCESSQDEVTTLHNMRLDGTQLAMLKLYIAKRGAGIDKDTQLQPHQILFMDDPKNDFVPIDFPDVAPSALQAEAVAKDYASRTTGVSDMMAGFGDPVTKSGSTVGGTMFAVQQGNSILNAVLETAVQAITNILVKAFYQCVANKDLVDLSWMSMNDQKIMLEILNMKIEEIGQKFKFSISVTDFSKTDEARKQNFLAATTIYAQYGQQAMQFAGALMNPQIAGNPLMIDLVRSMYVGLTKFTGKLFDFLDIGESGDYLPFVKDMEFMQSMLDQQRQQQLDAQKASVIDASGEQAALGLGDQVGAFSGASGGMAPGGAGPGGPVAGPPNGVGGQGPGGPPQGA